MIQKNAQSATSVHRLVIARASGYSGHPNNTTYKAANGDKPIITAVPNPIAIPALITVCGGWYSFFICSRAKLLLKASVLVDAQVSLFGRTSQQRRTSRTA
jgi:hypothetical protein